jgi:membrane protein required for beta-lactamase induction
MPRWLADRGQTLDRESVRVRLPSSLTRRLGETMRASQKSKRKEAKANRSTLSMATHNLVNMVAITAVSGVVLLALLAVRRF